MGGLKTKVDALSGEVERLLAEYAQLKTRQRPGDQPEESAILQKSNIALAEENKRLKTELQKYAETTAELKSRLETLLNKLRAYQNPTDESDDVFDATEENAALRAEGESGAAADSPSPSDEKKRDNTDANSNLTMDDLW